MRKSDLVREVAKETGLTLKDSELAINSLLEVVKETLAKGEEVALNGFGKWETYATAPRKGVNPATREEIQIPASTRVRFKTGINLKRAAKGQVA